MKTTLTALILCLSFSAFSQIPPGYYDSTVGKTGYALKTELARIITAGHIDRGYGNLYTGYLTSDNDAFYDNDNTVLDMYSENPSGPDPYFYNHGARRCGNYSGENSCHNREHLFPQSGFGRGNPMRNDIHHVVPSDGYVNGQRQSYPFGEVSSTTWTSQNGSKKGPSASPGYQNIVFEPIDEFKGDIARCMLYFATRYETQIAGWSWGPLNGTSYQVYDQWFLNVLIKWHLQDTVNAREITRNNASYVYQGNRNPFIDNPQWVTQIWGTPNSSGVAENQVIDASVFPNPTNNHSVTITNSQRIENIEVYNALGQSIDQFSQNISSGKRIELTNLPQGVLLIRISSGNSSVVKRMIVE
ncbi:MAG: endonuclease [Flavobacteriales bacterium]